MIVLPHAKGLDRAEIRRRQAGRGDLARASGPDRGFQESPSISSSSKIWMKSYRPHELFDERGKFREEFAALAPTGHRRMGSNPHANGGELLRAAVDAALPRLRRGSARRPAASRRKRRGFSEQFLRDVMKLNLDKQNFRLFGPDETASNRLEAVYEVSGKEWMADVEEVDINLSVDGRVMEVLSEHLCEGWLEGYLLTGRHGLFSCYEAFIHIIDSMFNQHAKWLKVTRNIPWRKPIASLNYLLTSHVWRQDHNGFSHQDPGFIDHVANKKSDDRAHLSAARRKLPAVGRGSLSCAAATTST